MSKKTTKGKPGSLEDKIVATAKKTTLKWSKQRKREERNTARASGRRSYFRQTSDRVTIKDVVEKHMEEVYNVVSGDNTTPAYARQLFYRMRKIVEEKATPENELRMGYFSQTLLPNFIEERGHYDWMVSYDDRGHFKMPHHSKDEDIGCGTLAVDEYLNQVQRHVISVDDYGQFEIPTAFKTKGLCNRCSAILFIEKEGYFPIFEHVKLCERYDLALLSTKGQSVTAARALVDYLCGELGYPLLVLHDFDMYGIRILKTLVSSTRRYTFKNEINYIDFGLRFPDIEEWNLESESCKTPIIDHALATQWMTDQEREYLASGRRTELNAFTSPNFISWIESKLKEHKIRKVIPDADLLEKAYRRAWTIRRINGQQQDITEAARRESDEIEIPKDLTKLVRAKLKRSPAIPWDKALVQVIGDKESAG